MVTKQEGTSLSDVHMKAGTGLPAVDCSMSGMGTRLLQVQLRRQPPGSCVQGQWGQGRIAFFCTFLGKVIC